MPRAMVVACVLVTVTVPGARAEDVQPIPPAQPASGPAGSDYPYPGDPARSGDDGLGGFTLYEPTPTPAGSVPLVIMLRGACVGTCNMTSTNNIMNAWREHLVKKGSIVVFPHYQMSDEPDLEETRIITAIKDALALLATQGHATPDLARLGILGHSRGSQMTLNVAMLAASAGLPAPKWLLVVEPGPTSRLRDEFTSIPPDTKVVVVVGEDDTVAGEAKAKDVWEKLDAAGFASGNRDYVRVRSHRRGVWSQTGPVQGEVCEASQTAGSTVALAGCATTNTVWGFTPKYNAVRNAQNPASSTGELVADHLMPALPDPLAVHALWKISQALVECTGGATQSCAYALGGAAPQRDMGTWSDGVPVHPLCMTHDPDESWEESCAA